MTDKQRPPMAGISNEEDVPHLSVAEADYLRDVLMGRAHQTHPEWIARVLRVAYAATKDAPCG